MHATICKDLRTVPLLLWSSSQAGVIPGLLGRCCIPDAHRGRRTGSLILLGKEGSLLD